MKKTIFIITLIIFAPRVICQNSFPYSNAIWNENHLNSQGTMTAEKLYGLKGDTLINDTLYNKLYSLSDTTLDEENLQNYIGGFRQVGQKVYFRPEYWAYKDILLYDFSASVGDTVWHNAIAYYGKPTFEIGYTFSKVLEIENKGFKT